MDSKYIQVYDQCLDPDFCQELIDMFERSEHLYNKVDKDAFGGEATRLTQIDITKESYTNAKFKEYHDKLVSVGEQIINSYISNLPSPVYPDMYTNTWEQFRIKRYLPNGEEGFGLHCDASHTSSITRWLAFFWYLNDVDEGGSTTFLYNDDEELGSVEAKRGRCLVFPPLWTYPHRGEPPISSNKYIVGSYLHVREF